MANGCGPYWMPEWMKEKHFEKSCNIHDKDYTDTKIGRKKADDKFLDNMLENAETRPRKAQAYLYYGLVRMFGWTSWGVQR